MSINKAITEFFANLTKEPAEEAGGMLADRIRFWRIKQAVSLKEKLQTHLKQRGITDTREVPLKLTVAILDGATMEEDDELHSEWAKLLANAVDPNFNDEIRVAYADILRSMNALDARLLHEIYREATSRRGLPPHRVEVSLLRIGERLQLTKEEVELSRDCLLRQRCIVQALRFEQPAAVMRSDGETRRLVRPPKSYVGPREHSVMLTQLGAAFVRACS